jgi:deoxyribose-phosphate aldolase
MKKYYQFITENKNNLNKIIDFTFLKDNYTSEDIKKICDIVIENNYYSLCTKSKYISIVKAFLENTNIKICSTISFPYGKDSTKDKLLEIQTAINDGADEIDFTINYNKLLNINNSLNDEDVSNIKNYLKTEIRKGTELCHSNGIIIKAIIETDLLNYNDINNICEILIECNVDFIQTSTGYAKKSDSLETKLNKIKYIKKIIPDYINIKVSGGIKTQEQAKIFLPYVDRIGTSSTII